MYKQKFKEREKAFAQQQKELKNLKAHGKSKAHAVRGGQLEMKILNGNFELERVE